MGYNAFFTFGALAEGPFAVIDLGPDLDVLAVNDRGTVVLEDGETFRMLPLGEPETLSESGVFLALDNDDRIGWFKRVEGTVDTTRVLDGEEQDWEVVPAPLRAIVNMNRDDSETGEVFGEAGHFTRTDLVDVETGSYSVNAFWLADGADPVVSVSVRMEREYYSIDYEGPSPGELSAYSQIGGEGSAGARYLFDAGGENEEYAWSWTDDDFTDSSGEGLQISAGAPSSTLTPSWSSFDQVNGYGPVAVLTPLLRNRNGDWVSEEKEYEVREVDSDISVESTDRFVFSDGTDVEAPGQSVSAIGRIDDQEGPWKSWTGMQVGTGALLNRLSTEGPDGGSPLRNGGANAPILTPKSIARNGLFLVDDSSASTTRLWRNGRILSEEEILGTDSPWSSLSLSHLSDSGAFVAGTATKEGTGQRHAVLLLQVDLDIDSDNNNGVGPPDRSAAEEALEDDDEKTGKLIGVNNGDRDFDNIPDYADGFDGETLTGMNFTQLILEMPDGIEIDKLKVKLIYSASDPAGVTVTNQNSGASQNGSDSSWTTRDGKIYNLPSGNIRLWLKDASESRNSASVLSNGNFIPSNTEIPFEKINGGGSERLVTLYIEGVKPSDFPGEDTIQLEFGIECDGAASFFEADTVRFTATDVVFRDGSGDGFLGRDDYTFNSADFSSYSLSDGMASLVVYSMITGGSLNVETLTIPAAPQGMSDVINYSAGQRQQGPYLLAGMSVSPETSSSVTQALALNSIGSRGFTYVDAVAGDTDGQSAPSGSAGLVVFDERIIRLGVRVVELSQAAGPNHNGPSISVVDIVALEEFLNQVYRPANIVWSVELLPSVSIDYDLLNNNGQLDLGFLNSDAEERNAVIAAGDDQESDYMLFLVHDIPGNGGGAFLETDYAYLDASHMGSIFNVDSAHEIGHSLGLPHPFEYEDKTTGDYLNRFGALPNDFDPENVMNYVRGPKLRLFQWLFLNPGPQEQ